MSASEPFESNDSINSSSQPSGPGAALRLCTRRVEGRDDARVPRGLPRFPKGEQHSSRSRPARGRGGRRRGRGAAPCLRPPVPSAPTLRRRGACLRPGPASAGCGRRPRRVPSGARRSVRTAPGRRAPRRSNPGRSRRRRRGRQPPCCPGRIAWPENTASAPSYPQRIRRNGAPGLRNG